VTRLRIGEHGLPIRRGRGPQESEQFYIRFCFPDMAIADAFHDRFGDERMTYAHERARRRQL
jgi:hypothetical protein